MARRFARITELISDEAVRQRSWPPRPRERPRIVVTMGTVLAMDEEPWRSILAAAGDTGAGLTAEGVGVTADQLHRLLHDVAIRTAIAEVRAELDAMPSPAELVLALAAIAQT
ncbi:hypothetical protein M8C13_30495 [Crossiella sp. SN42]|uniref:hypothetical protein n=1 Tax=Crossiella sp. SN42 TaxID=2944808 RepID=UPI00207CB21F|nr:hypothetical protein [Crossiella sp. SN42]MCO1580092.1 hypothetical protein [Crossiella sp. SN42]